MMVLAEDFVCMDIIIKGRVFTGFTQDCGQNYMSITIRGKISTGVLQGVWSVIRDFSVHLSTRPSGSTC